jgi:hypothetical protein
MSPFELLIKEVAGSTLALVTRTGKVISIDETARTCDVEFEDGVTAPILGCRLNSIVSDYKDSVVLIPRKGSYVFVVSVGGRNEDVFVMGYSEIDKVLVKIGDTSVNMDRDGVVFNGGDNKGLVKVQNMVDWMSKVHQDLTTLTSLLLNTAVAGNGAPLGIVFNPGTPSPQASNFENDKVKH